MLPARFERFSWPRRPAEQRPVGHGFLPGCKGTRLGPRRRRVEIRFSACRPTVAVRRIEPGAMSPGNRATPRPEDLSPQGVVPESARRAGRSWTCTGHQAMKGADRYAALKLSQCCRSLRLAIPRGGTHRTLSLRRHAECRVTSSPPSHPDAVIGAEIRTRPADRDGVPPACRRTAALVTRVASEGHQQPPKRTNDLHGHRRHKQAITWTPIYRRHKTLFL